MRRNIVVDGKVASCYFRSSVAFPYRKALLQITENCNLHCVHCFISAGIGGRSLSLKNIENYIIPKLKQCRVISITLTGGEPFMHKEIIDIINLFRDESIKVGICTNGTLISNDHIKKLSILEQVHINVSLDGFSPKSHGRFRGNEKSFIKTINTIRVLGESKLLQGLLVTPNNLAEPKEYAEICEFAYRNGASYVLMNPLSNMGRGAMEGGDFKSSDDSMREIKKITKPYRDALEIVYIRFPNDEGLPLSSCEAGNIFYIFVNGEVAICPYLVFAARTPLSKHGPEEFIIGNIFNDIILNDKLETYSLQKNYHYNKYELCKECSICDCGKGCPAAVVMSWQRIGSIDMELCPFVFGNKNNN